MNRLVIVLLCITFSKAHAQQPYWQQQTDYTIDVSLNDAAHTLKGSLQLAYTNHSPDTLTFIWFHLWLNAYKDRNTAFAQQLFRDDDGAKRWSAMKDKGFIDSLQFKVDGVAAATEAHPDHNDVIKLVLPHPLPPQQKVEITTPFFVKLPTYNSRSGHYGQSYAVCQWYPKPAVYDRKGWHPMPYLDQGEFYSEYGAFNVNITVPTTYVVGASGVLKNSEELTAYKEIGKKNKEGKKEKYKPTENGFKTLRFTGENIHDFAWFADKDFIIQYDTLQTAGGETVDVFAYHHPNGNRHWKNGTDYIKSAVQHYSAWVGEYPYPVVAAVEGPKNDMSGGMEYPMITLITSPDASEEYLDAVITHEVGHNWFYGILGSNEREHAWMDEGINTYYQFRYEAEKYRANSVLGKSAPVRMKDLSAKDFETRLYRFLGNLPMEKPISTPAYGFSDKNEYGIVEYIKTSLWMHMLESATGRADVDKAIQYYFAKWKFKHPYPEDLKAAFEEATSKGFNEAFLLLDKTGALQ